MIEFTQCVIRYRFDSEFLVILLQWCGLVRNHSKRHFDSFKKVS